MSRTSTDLASYMVLVLLILFVVVGVVAVAIEERGAAELRRRGREFDRELRRAKRRRAAELERRRVRLREELRACVRRGDKLGELRARLALLRVLDELRRL